MTLDGHVIAGSWKKKKVIKSGVNERNKYSLYFVQENDQQRRS
jgi:hypothetical protein